MYFFFHWRAASVKFAVMTCVSSSGTDGITLCGLCIKLSTARQLNAKLLSREVIVVLRQDLKHQMTDDTECCC